MIEEKKAMEVGECQDEGEVGSQKGKWGVKKLAVFKTTLKMLQ